MKIGSGAKRWKILGIFKGKITMFWREAPKNFGIFEGRSQKNNPAWTFFHFFGRFEQDFKKTEPRAKKMKKIDNIWDLISKTKPRAFKKIQTELRGGFDSISPVVSTDFRF